MAVTNRCVFIEGMGLFHVLDDGDPRLYPHVAWMDALQPLHSFTDIIRACDQAIGVMFQGAPGRILWSVRFKEKERDNAS